jgi:hypothetical protein
VVGTIVGNNNDWRTGKYYYEWRSNKLRLVRAFARKLDTSQAAIQQALAADSPVSGRKTERPALELALCFGWRKHSTFIDHT